MTPAGRPPRVDSPNRKSISVRVSLEELADWKAATTGYISDWIRETCNVAVGRARTPMVRIPDSVVLEAMESSLTMSREICAVLESDAPLTAESRAEIAKSVRALVEVVRAQERERVAILEVKGLEEGLARFIAATQPKEPTPP